MNRHSLHRQRIGPAIRRMRRSRGMTLDELAYNAVVSPSHLSRLERTRTLPSFSVLARIADALDVDINEFVQLEQDVAQIDAELSLIVNNWALEDEAQGELFDLSIEARRSLVQRIEQLARVAPTPYEVQDQVVRALSSSHEDAPFSAVGTLIERRGLAASGLPRVLHFLDLLYGRRSAIIAGPSLLPIPPGQDLVGAYRSAFSRSPIDPVVARWWQRSPDEIASSHPADRSIRAIITEQALGSSLGPTIARSFLSESMSLSTLELAITKRPLGSVNMLSVAGGYGVLEQLVDRSGNSEPNHVALWLTGPSRVGPCEEIVDRIWGTLSEHERDSALVRSQLAAVVA